MKNLKEKKNVSEDNKNRGKSRKINKKHNLNKEKKPKEVKNDEMLNFIIFKN